MLGTLVGLSNWGALPPEVKDLARAANFRGVGALRVTAQPASWWAQLLGLRAEQVLPNLGVLKEAKIVDVSEPGSRYFFTPRGNDWARDLVEAQSIEEDPLGPPDLVMIARSATSAREVLDAAPPFCPNLDFPRFAVFHAQECCLPAPLHELANALLTLQAMAVAATNGDLGRPVDKWITQHCLENNRGSLRFKSKDNSTLGHPRRSIKIAGQAVKLHEHFSMGSGPKHHCVSLYFIRFPSNATRITIGYCGPHL